MNIVEGDESQTHYNKINYLQYILRRIHMKQLIVKVPDEVHKELKTMAFFNETTMKDIVLDLILEKLKEEGANK